MKRSYRCVLLVVLLVVCAIVLSGCVSVDETIHVDDTTETSRYFLYRVNDPKKYLLFLENFDDEKYEIINISISTGEYAEDTYDDIYSITYRRK